MLTAATLAYPAALAAYIVVCLVTSLLVVGLLVMRRRLGVGVLWLWIGATVTLLWAGSNHRWPLVGPTGQPLYLGTGVIEPSLLLLLLLVYIEHGARDVRRLYVGIAATGLLFFGVNQLAALGGDPLVALSWRYFAASVVATGAALAAMAVSFQVGISRRWGLPVAALFAGAFMVGMLVDLAVFPVVSGATFTLQQRLSDGPFLLSKLLSVAFLGLPAVLYLQRQHHLGRRLAIADMSPLAIAGVGDEGPIPDAETWRTVADTLGDGLSVAIAGRVVFVNTVMARMAGYDRPEAMAGRPFGDFVVAEDLPRLLREQQERERGAHGTGRFEWRLRRRDGSVRLFESTAQRALLGRSACTIAVHRDVTDERENRERLKETSNALRALMGGASALVASRNPGRIVPAICTRALDLVRARTVVLLERREADGQLFCRHVEGDPWRVPAGTGVTDAELSALTDTESGAAIVPLAVDHEELGVLLVLPGADRPVEAGERYQLLEALADLGAAALRTARLVRDLQQAELRYQTLFDQVPTPVWLYHPTDHRILAANAAAVRRYGWTRDEFLTMSLADLEAGDPAAGPRGRITPPEGAGGPAVVRQHRTKSGEVLDVLATGTHVEIGGVQWGIAACVDLTRERRQQERLHTSERLESLGRLAGGIAHDFNNILTAVQMDLGLLEHEYAGDGQLQGSLAHIRSATERAADLTRQILLFSRGEEPQRRSIRLNEVVRELERLLRRSLGTTVSLTTQLSGDDPQVYADPSQLQQILVNLCLNARDAMPRGGSIVVRTSRITVAKEAMQRLGLTSAAAVLLEVQDSGTGMAPAVLSRAVEPFFTTKPQGQGTGLGLSIVHGVLRSHDGALELTSVPGEGTIVRAYLPELPATEGSPPARRTSEMGGSETILLVDDDAAVRRAGGRMLERFGYRVISAEDGADALRRLEAEGAGVDLVVTDMVMPVMDARDLILAIRERWPDMPVVLATGYDAGRLAGGESALFDDFVPKPYTPAELLTVVRALLDRNRPSPRT